MNAQARQRAAVVFQVRSGQMTATDAARTLGISRQQYYQWEQRALQALLTSLKNRPTGRPKRPADPEKLALQRRVTRLEQQLQQHEQKAQLRQWLNQWAAREDLPPAKKNAA